MEDEDLEYCFRSYKDDFVSGFENTNKNKFAVAGFVLSTISIFLSPLFIFQILGMVFSIKGFKSQRRGLATVGIILSILAIVLGVMFISYLDSTTHSSQRRRADTSKATLLQSAIQSYIVESDDKYLIYLGNKLTVESIVNNLKGEITINGVKYGPYIKKSWTVTTSSRYKGFEMLYDIKTQLVTVAPSKKGNSVIIKN